MSESGQWEDDMEEHAIRLLKESSSPLRTIRQIVQHSKMREIERSSYAVKLLNIARQVNLL